MAARPSRSLHRTTPGHELFAGGNGHGTSGSASPVMITDPRFAPSAARRGACRESCRTLSPRSVIWKMPNTSLRRRYSMAKTATCLCGQFRVVVASEPTVVNVCHCRDCQRRSGVPWTSNAYFPKESVRLEGPNNVYTRASNAGNRINHHFCPTCGVTVCWARETGATRFGIPVGTFNDPSFPAPTVSFWEERGYAWSPQMTDVEHWDTQPPPP
jgi:hypothetical protein